MRALYVEDSAADADLARRALRRSAPTLELDVATTLSAARALLDEHAYDVVLLDLGLPDGSGFDFLAELGEAVVSPAVVVLTGSGEQDVALSALKAGADDYVTKRDDYLAQLPAALTSAIERHHEHAQRRSRRMRVLYAEPNAFDVDLTRRHFARHAPHIRLDLVALADEVLTIFDGATGYDAVVLDYRLPGIDGLELVRILRRQRGLDVPIVLLTGHGSGEIAAKALRLGVDDYLPKREGYLFELAVTLEKLQSQAELRRERAELTESEKRFRNLFEHTPAIAVQGYDRNCRVLYWNRASESLYGYTAEQAMGRDLVDLIVPEPQREAMRALAQRWTDSGAPVPATELALQRQDGTPVHVLTSVVTFTTAHGEKEIYSVDVDLSERVASRRLQQARTEVLNGIAADAPLDTVLGTIVAEVESLLTHSQRVDVLFFEPGGKVLADVRRHRLALLDDALAQRCVAAGSQGMFVDLDSVGDDHAAALWSAPLRDEAGTVIGALAVSCQRPGEPAAGEREILAEFASLASLAVQKRRVADAVRQREDALEMAARAALELLREDDLDLGLRTVLEAVGRHVGGDSTYVFEVHPHPDDGRPAASIRHRWETEGLLHHVPDAEVTDLPIEDVGLGRWLECLGRGDSFVADIDELPEAERRFFDDKTVASIMLLPLFCNGSLWGCVGIETEVRRQHWSASDESVLRIVAAGISAAIERKLALDSLRRAAAVFESTRDGIVITDLHGFIVAINRAYTEITGFTEAEALGRKSSLLRSERQGERFYRELWQSLRERGHWQGEVWNRRKDGEVGPTWLSISTVRDAHGNATQYVGVMTDISQLKNSEAELQRLAHFDPLTGLPNRVLVNLRLEHAIDHAARHGHAIAVLFIDLDRFKDVNDSFGHPVGDELLVQIGLRLRSRVRADDTLARLGGDEFLMVMERLDEPEEAARVAMTLIRLLDDPFVLSGGQEVYVGSSVGISIYPQDGADPTELIQHADAALYQAKAEGRSTFRFYTAELSRAAQQRVELETRMRRALERDEFELHYQPQIDVPSGRIVGCEALLRWRDPERGLISPGEFIPIAEGNGLIVPLGEWTLRAACEQARRWTDAGLAPMTMAVNLSGRQLWHSDLPQRIALIIEETGIDPARLELELTESTIMGHEELAGERLRELKALGVTLAIDDFGTGYSSLAYLKRFPIDVLKIDREFVRDVPHDVGDMEIASAIVAMARTLRMRVVAEGVETGDQLEFLKGQSCDLYQGFLFSPAVLPDAFVRLLGAPVAT
ncbi:EAL domain-containing protein [Pseudazoarcus pumilus]|uniref:Response regulator receiver protein n=1 Tax=Pseudazoarcus pumilus TaxID=2067960 RepID=A0A2I6S5U8_9RHOO|nr:EAL domain-containing protein [Pseudazoarcus pumilus]AUN94624.1 response regulator receiver protein [Pseudazoarcus pumilus]